MDIAKSRAIARTSSTPFFAKGPDLAHVEKIEPNGPSELVVGEGCVEPIAQGQANQGPEHCLAYHDASGLRVRLGEVGQP